MSALDFAARAKALEALLIAERGSGTAETAQATAVQAESHAKDARTAVDQVSATLETSRKDIDAAAAGAKLAGEAAEAASKTAEGADRLAREAAASASRLFGQVAAARLPASVSKFDTSGYATEGRGAASYVCDRLADAKLAAAHPLACFAGEGGRFFRLLPDAQGFITPEQLGCPTYAAGVNAQPFIQAAINYVGAVGLQGVAFPQEKYELWTPLRNADASHASPHRTGTGGYLAHGSAAVSSGFPVVINRRTTLRAAPGGTSFFRRKFDGSDPAVFAGTQKLNNGYFWRGGMFLLNGGPSPRQADYSQLPGIDFQGRWKIVGGIPKSATPGQYVPAGEAATGKLRADGSGWDWSDKPIWFSNDRHTGDVTFDHLEIGGFRGELIYQGGQTHGSIRGDRMIMCDTDGDGLNPMPMFCEDGQPGRIEIKHFTAHHCYQAMEGGGGRGASRVGLLEIFDCNLAGGLHGGVHAQGPEDYDPVPSLRIDRWILERSGTVAIMQLTQIGEILAKDTQVHLGYQAGHIYNTMIGRILYTADRLGSTPVMFRSINLEPANKVWSQDARIGEIVHARTPYARANNISSNAAVCIATGHYGPNIRIGRLSGEFGGYVAVVGNTADLTGHPIVVEQFGGSITSQGSPINVETTPVLASPNGHSFRLSTTTASGNFPFSLPNVYGTNAQRGMRLRFFNNNNNNGAVISIQTTNTRMDRRLLLLPQQAVEFESDGNVWLLVTERVSLTSATTATFQKAGAPIPGGDVSDEVTIAMAGARSGMEVRVIPTATLPADAQIIGRVSANDMVAIRVRNLNLTAPLAMSNAALRISASWAS